MKTKRKIKKCKCCKEHPCWENHPYCYDCVEMRDFIRNTAVQIMLIKTPLEDIVDTLDYEDGEEPISEATAIAWSIYDFFESRFKEMYE